MLTSKIRAGGKKGNSARPAEPYRHPEAESPMRPDVGTQAQFKKKKPPVTYRYDSSLSPALDWDGQNSAREQGEEQLSVIGSELSVLREKLVAQRSPSSAAAVPSIEKPQGQKADPALQALAKVEEATAGGTYIGLHVCAPRTRATPLSPRPIRGLFWLPDGRRREGQCRRHPPNSLRPRQQGARR